MSMLFKSAGLVCLWQPVMTSHSYLYNRFHDRVTQLYNKCDLDDLTKQAKLARRRERVEGFIADDGKIVKGSREGKWRLEELIHPRRFGSDEKICSKRWRERQILLSPSRLIICGVSDPGSTKRDTERTWEMMFGQKDSTNPFLLLTIIVAMMIFWHKTSRFCALSSRVVGFVMNYWLQTIWTGGDKDWSTTIDRIKCPVLQSLFHDNDTCWNIRCMISVFCAPLNDSLVRLHLLCPAVWDERGKSRVKRRQEEQEWDASLADVRRRTYAGHQEEGRSDWSKSINVPNFNYPWWCLLILSPTGLIIIARERPRVS